MGIESKVMCDSCGARIDKETDYPHKYGLVLSAKDFRDNTGRSVYAVHMRPPIDRDMCFCGIGCMCSWVSEILEN